jgi:hypothetical protein
MGFVVRDRLKVGAGGISGYHCYNPPAMGNLQVTVSGTHRLEHAVAKKPSNIHLIRNPERSTLPPDEAKEPDDVQT